MSWPHRTEPTPEQIARLAEGEERALIERADVAEDEKGELLEELRGRAATEREDALPDEPPVAE